jgi:hypothetical protein
MMEGLVRGEGFAVDASIVKADANRRRGVPSEEGIDWSNPELGTRAVREYLQALEEEGQIGTTPDHMNPKRCAQAARLCLHRPMLRCGERRFRCAGHKCPAKGVEAQPISSSRPSKRWSRFARLARCPMSESHQLDPRHIALPNGVTMKMEALSGSIP